MIICCAIWTLCFLPLVSFSLPVLSILILINFRFAVAHSKSIQLPRCWSFHASNGSPRYFLTPRCQFFYWRCWLGAWGVIPTHLSEISPVAFRATFPGVCYQLGNMISSSSAQIEATAGLQYLLPNGAPDYGKVSTILIGVSNTLLPPNRIELAINSKIDFVWNLN